MDINQEIRQAPILIVDDEASNVVLLERVLRRKGFSNITTTQDPRQVEPLWEQSEFDALLLDIRMPYMDGYQVMTMLQEKCSPDDYIPVLVMTAQNDMETRLKALESGAKDFLNKPFDHLEALVRIQNLLEVRLMHKRIKNHNALLEQQVKQRTEELYQTRLEIIRQLGLATEFRDNETGNHIIRMSKYARLLGQAYGLNSQNLDNLFNAAPMHDIGKIAIPDAILFKPGKLDDEEWKIMKTHVEIGAQILSSSSSELMQTARLIALHHHEKWDGSGYPAGLKGEEISLVGRICTLADVFDALTSNRPYKKAWTVEATLAFIEQESGKQFDPGLVKLLPEVLPEMLKIKEQFADN